MIVNNVAITPIIELWHTIMCAGHVYGASVSILLLINHLKTKYRYTARLVSNSRRHRFGLTAINCLARFLVIVDYT